jgi:hypothetical protein
MRSSRSLALPARAGLPLAGHLQTDVTVEEAADSGQRSLEHLDGFLNPCSAADSVRLSAAYPLDRYVLGECSTSDQTPVYRHIATRPTWVTPTFVALEMLAALPKERLPSDTLAHYLPPTLRAAMAAALEIPPDMPADASVLGRALWTKRLEVVKGLAQSGVPILAGTDAPLPNSIPGLGCTRSSRRWCDPASPHGVRCGPRQAEPARYFASDTVGTVCTGCVADLVVLNADPLRDIRNTRRIALVVADGRAYSPTALAALRESALRAARSRAKSQ